MKPNRLTVVAGVIGAAVLAVPALLRAQDDVPDHTLSDFKLGDIVSGDKVDLDKTEGKVVAIEYWGTR